MNLLDVSVYGGMLQEKEGKLGQGCEQVHVGSGRMEGVQGGAPVVRYELSVWLAVGWGLENKQMFEDVEFNLILLKLCVQLNRARLTSGAFYMHSY